MTKTTIGIYEAKNKLSEIVERVEAGETITFTRHGKEVALLSPVRQERFGARQAIDRIRRLRKGSRLGGLSITALRDEGRP